MPTERFMRHHYGPSGYVPPLAVIGRLGGTCAEYWQWWADRARMAMSATRPDSPMWRDAYAAKRRYDELAANAVECGI
jgi:hypothetical protein